MSIVREILDEATMSFGDHLEELRRRIIAAAAPALPLAIILFFFSDSFIRILIVPLRRVLEAQGLPPRLQALAPPEVLLLKLKLSLILAAVILAPWILWQAWLFIRPGLYGQERRFVRFLIPGSVVLTAAGITLLYFFMLPLMLQVLVTVGSDLDLGQSAPSLDARAQSVLNGRPGVELLTADPDTDGLNPGRAWLLLPELELRVSVADEDGVIEMITVPRRERAMISQDYRLSTYISFVLLLLVGIVIAFQMPMVILLAGWVGLASPDWLAANLRYALLACGVASALLTPADVVSMLVMLFPLYGLYELGILLLRIAPASAVAEGTILGRKPSGNSRGGPADKASSDSGQPIEPVQPEASLPRSSTAAPPAEERRSDQTD